MPMPGQASGDYTESSSALRILYVGHRNSFSATLTSDGFTQTNPPIVDDHVSERLSPTPKYGVLSGSVCFTRPDEGNGYVGGPLEADPDDGALTPLGLFINDAEGNAYENTPGPASGQGPYVSAQGTMGSMLYETQALTGAGAPAAAGDDLDYHPGDKLYASQNGYLTNVPEDSLEVEHDGDATVVGIVKVAPDASHGEVVFDQRI